MEANEEQYNLCLSLSEIFRRWLRFEIWDSLSINNYRDEKNEAKLRGNGHRV